jgi:hypothetical protein
MASFVARTRIDFSSGGHLKEHVFAVPSNAIEDLMARLKARCDDGRYQHVRSSSR